MSSVNTDNIIELMNENTALKARIAALEAERDELRRRADTRTTSLNEAETRIAVLEAALREAKRRLENGRALWNGPCHECAAVIDDALASAPETGGERHGEG